MLCLAHFLNNLPHLEIVFIKFSLLSTTFIYFFYKNQCSSVLYSFELACFYLLAVYSWYNNNFAQSSLCYSSTCSSSFFFFLEQKEKKMRAPNNLFEFFFFNRRFVQTWIVQNSKWSNAKDKFFSSVIYLFLVVVQISSVREQQQQETSNREGLKFYYASLICSRT